MTKKFQFKRGLKSNLDTLSPAEMAFTTDEKSVYIGDGIENIKLLDQKDKLEITNTLTESVNYTKEEILGVPPNYLNIPSTLSDGLATHPSVIDFGNNHWSGYRYWMAFTPYPGIKNENPCIAASNDNENWIVPTGVTNPLVPAPPETKGYNSDVEMIFISETSKLRIYYRQFDVTSNAQIYFIESANGVNWDAPVLSIDTPSVMLSPAIIKLSSNSYKMWYVLDEKRLGYRTSTDGVVWSEESVQTQPWTKGVWHISVAKDSKGRYHLMGSAYSAKVEEGVQYRPIYYAHSNNGITWVANNTPQIIPSGWANGYLYRPSFILDETKTSGDDLPYMKVWFSAATATGNWHIGYSEGFLRGNSTETVSNKDRSRKNIYEAFKGLFGIIKVGAAFISNVVAEKVTIKNAFESPKFSLKDGRINTPTGSEAQFTWSGDSVDDNNRLRFMFSKAGEPLSIVFQMSPFKNWVGFVSPGSLANIKEINTIGQEFQIVARDKDNVSNVIMKWDANEKAINFQSKGLHGLSDVRSTRFIAYNEGVRIYRQNSTSEFTRLHTDETGSLLITSRNQSADYFKFREDGDIQAINAGVLDLEYLNYKAQTAKPGSLTASRPGMYLADGATHDPCAIGSGKPYLVYWDGTSYTKL